MPYSFTVQNIEADTFAPEQVEDPDDISVLSPSEDFVNPLTAKDDTDSVSLAMMPGPDGVGSPQPASLLDLLDGTQSPDAATPATGSAGLGKQYQAFAANAAATSERASSKPDDLGPGPGGGGSKLRWRLADSIEDGRSMNVAEDSPKVTELGTSTRAQRGAGPEPAQKMTAADSIRQDLMQSNQSSHNDVGARDKLVREQAMVAQYKAFRQQQQQQQQQQVRTLQL
jgi:hypothetical protein